MRKKFEKKFGGKEKSSTFAIPFGTRGTGEAEGSGKNRKRKFIEKTGRRQEKVPKKSTSVYSVRETGQVIIEPERQER